MVLQGQSLEAIQTPVSFDNYGTRLGNAAHAAGAEVVWYATWARREGDPFYLGKDGVTTPAEMTAVIDSRYQNVAAEAGGVVARVGAAWQLALAELPGVALHAEDGSHPTAEGTLLAGCVMLQALTGQTPVVPEPPPLGIPTATAAALCALAPRVAPVAARCPEVACPADERCTDTGLCTDDALGSPCNVTPDLYFPERWQSPEHVCYVGVCIH